MSALKSFTPGTKATYCGQRCELLRVAGVAEVMVQLKDTGETKIVRVSDLEEPKAESRRSLPHPDALSPKKIAAMEQRFEIIRSLTNRTLPRGEIQKIAKQSGKSVRTIYRWLERYNTFESRAALAPQHGQTRARRLSDDVEAIIRTAIEVEYLHTQKKSPKKVIEAVEIRCRAAGLNAPDHKTVRRRIAKISPKEATQARRGKKAARDRFDPAAGDFPGASHPLSVVQIDHHYLDLILVDDISRKPIGRPWLTLAIDVFSRMVVGYYLSLEAPSAQSVGMCVQNAILPKDQALADLNVANHWDVWGRMATLHADNGKDFRCKSVSEACIEHGISIEWRPVKTPNWGGRIERLFGTIAKEFHALPGTTFSNTRDRDGYDSDKNSAMTFKEAQRWLLLWITGVYHERIHSQLNMSPRAMWERGLLGDGKNLKGIGIPPKHQDPERLRIDFLPFKECIVQRQGITMNHVRYYSDEIRCWIGYKVNGLTPKFKVRRDPLDISTIYFLDPQKQDYIPVPFLDIGHPTITVWELKEAIKELKRQGAEKVNEALIFRTIEEMGAVVKSAKTETKKARRTNQRRKQAKLHRENTSTRAGHSTLRSEQKVDDKPPLNLQIVVDNDAPHSDQQNEEEYYEFSEEDLNAGWHD